MVFFNKCAKQVRFKLIIMAYIIGSILWWIIQYKDKISSNILETLKMQDIIGEYSKKQNTYKHNAKQQLTKKSDLNPQKGNLFKNLTEFNGVASVTSGVTFKLITPVMESWRKHIVRNVHLYGVDTCAPRQKAKLKNQEWPCGAVVTAWLVTKTLNQNLSCKQAIKRNNIHYAQCFVRGIDLAEAGLAEGIFIVSKDKKSPVPTQYLNAEKIARNNKIGLWSSDFTEPSKWRRDNGSYNPFENLL
ncbi:hypothetical protein [Bartonella sp. B41]